MTALYFDQLPVPGAPITGGFGADYGTYRHRGVDFGVPLGTPVLAPARGRAITVHNPDRSFGNAVALDHEGTPWFTLYAHLSAVHVVVGQLVESGDIIGVSGNTGVSSGPHLHWQMSGNPQWPAVLEQNVDPLLCMRPPAPPEDEMTAAERAELNDIQRRLARAEGIIGGTKIVVNGQPLTGEAALEYLRNDGASLALGQGDLQAQMLEIRTDFGYA